MGGARTLISSQEMEIYMTPYCLGSPLPLSTEVSFDDGAPTIFKAAAPLCPRYQLVLKLPIGTALLKVHVTGVETSISMLQGEF